MSAHLLDEHARGIFASVPTPFTADGAIDLFSLDRLVAGYIEAGVHGLVILGTGSETEKLTFDEQRLVIDRILKQVAGEVPVIVGVTGPGLANVAALSSDAMSEGAAAVMAGMPFPQLPDEQIEIYWRQLSDAIGFDVPLMLQDCRAAHEAQMSVPLLHLLIEELPQIKAVHHEAAPGAGKTGRLRRAAARQGGRRVAIFAGLGGLYLPFDLNRGADGVVTGCAFPECLVEIYALFAEGNDDAALSLFDAVASFLSFAQQPGIELALAKQVLHRRGLIACPILRAPGPVLDRDGLQELDVVLARLKRVRSGRR